MALTPYFGRDPLWTWGAGPLSTFDEFSSLLDAPVGSFMRETQAVANTAVDVKETPKVRMAYSCFAMLQDPAEPSLPPFGS